MFPSLSWFERGSLRRMPAALKRGRRVRLGTGAVLAAALIVGLLPAQAVAAPPSDLRADVPLVDLQTEKTAKDADTGVLSELTGEATTPVVEYEPANTTVPVGGEFPVPLTTPTAGDLVQAGQLPVLVGPPEDATAAEAAALEGTWQVELATPEQAATAEVEGMLLTVTPPADATGEVDVALDYSDFEQLYSADWADRLQFVQYPECFLTTPDTEGCDEPVQLDTDNDDGTGQVKATLDVSALAAASGTSTSTASATSDGETVDALYRPSAKRDALQALLPAADSGSGAGVLAATDSGSGAKGDYTATPLVSAGTWSAGGSSGAFTWSQAVTVPAGPTPNVAFSYNSQIVDGRTSATNNQASWIGDGWEYNPGSIERTYRSCNDDTGNSANNASQKTSDLCWGSYNAVLNLGGSTTELVVNASTCPEGNLDHPDCDWVTANGDGSKVEKLKDTTKGNGDDYDDKDGEYWRVTTRDGAQYYFGLNKLPGWSSGKETTDSVFTVPVAGNHSLEPGHASTFADSFETQAWRWNLDYVVDVHGNAMSLWWNKETNYYAKNEKYKSPVSYTRGGYLTRIDYGQRSGALFSAEPIARVKFTTAERCFAEDELKCTDAGFTSRDYGQYRIWYDTPAHLYCSGVSGKRCPVSSPTFWSRKLLSSVTTEAQRTSGSTTLSTVDTWDLKQSFPRTLTDTSPPLWLESIARTGYAVDGSTEHMNAVEFSHNNLAMPNRVTTGSSDPRPAFDRLRIRRVVTEYGGEIDVEYSDPCASMAVSAHPDPEDNSTLCYPVYWSPDPDEETIDWFNKYVVDFITQKPRVDGVPDVVTEYDYIGNAAWAKNQTEFSKKRTRTYDQWRGYAQVNVLTGVNNSTTGAVRGKTATRYFRGMNDDPLPDGTTRSVTVADSTGAAIATDKSAFQGMAAESVTYTKAADDGSGGEVASRTVSYPSAHLLATRARDDVPDLKAYRIQTDKTITVTPSSGTGDDTRTSRTVKSTTLYDATYGLPYQVETLGDTGVTVTGDESCTITSYVHNADKHLIGLVKETKTTAGTCAQAATATGNDVVSASRAAYDDGAYAAAPTRGLATTAWSVDGAGTGWIRTAVTTYDSYGRATSVKDAADQTTTISYSPSDGQVFSTKAKNALDHTAATTVEPGRGTPLTATDTNGKTVTETYDALGRLTAVWIASQDPATDDPASKFSYDTTVGKPVAVTSSTLRDNGTYADTVVLYDGLGRERQSQSEAVGENRLITDTLYNANGTVQWTNNGYLGEGEPGTALFEKKSDFQVPNATVATYDGLGRPLTVTPYEGGSAQTSKRKTYTYGWDYTTVAQPTGAASTRSFFDANGRTVRVDYFTDALRSAHTSTSYTYDTRGNLASVEDTEGNAWSWEYDARGRPTKAVDPDTGTSTTTYNLMDQKVTTTDARSVTVWTGYDKIGRTTEQRLNNASGTQLTKFTYDSILGAVGQPVTATRYTDGLAISTAITGYDDAYRPTGKTITIPDSLTTDATNGLNGTYSYSYSYTKTGNLHSVTVPAVGGLQQEKVVTRYNADGLPVSTSGLDWYTAETTYSPYGEVLRAVTGEQPYRVWTTNFYDENSGQLTTSIADREDTETPRVNARYYKYDYAGNITILSDVPDGDATQTDRQCFTYDAQGQLTEAWTSANTGCLAPGKTHRAPTYTDSTGAVTATNVTASNDGYWQTYTYDSLGNRTKLVEHNANVTVTGGAVVTTGDVTTDYAYGIDPSGSGVLKQPHTLTKISSDSATVDTVADLSYDASGNTDTRTYGGDTQNIDWTWDGKVASVSGFGEDGEGQFVGLAGKCLDLAGASTTAGTPVQLYSCNGSKAQRFTIDPDTGALTTLGHCVMPTSGGTANGTTVTIAACTGADNQKWTVTANTLKHVSSGKCLDVPNANSADSTDLQLYTCNGSSAQTWTRADETTYLYDAAGNRLIASTAGAHTLYLDDAEFSTDANGVTAYAQRYYAHPGAPTVMRNSSRGSSTHTLTAMVTDHHGTAMATVKLASGQTVQKQKSDPFGVERGTQSGTWLSHRGYLGGTDDSQTGLTHLGAREYDPSTGRFISADPLLNVTDPLSMNGYAYANNNPITNSDASGLMCLHGSPGGGGDGICAGVPGDTDGVVGSDSNNCGASQHCYKGAMAMVETAVANGTYNKRIWFTDKGVKIGDTVLPTQQHLVEQLHYSPDVSYASNLQTWTRSQCTLNDSDFCRTAGQLGLMGTTADVDFLEVIGVRDYVDCYNGDGGACTDALIDIAISVGTAGMGKLAKAGGNMLQEGLKKGDVSAITQCVVGLAKDSFVAGTEVLLADGTTKPIEEIENGDVVLTTDPETGETEARPVVATIFTKTDKHYVELTIADEDGTGRIVTTDHHPFWSESAQSWTDAGNLAPGTTVRTNDGTTATVQATRAFEAHQDTYNLTVAGLHTYYVLAGETPVLVHNSTCPEYENPGHHDPTGGPNPYVPKKAVLPGDAGEQFGKSVLVDGTRWTKVGSGKSAEYYRYFDDGNGKWHWSGSTGGVTKSGTPVPIPMSRVPIQVKRG